MLNKMPLFSTEQLIPGFALSRSSHACPVFGYYNTTITVFSYLLKCF